MYPLMVKSGQNENARNSNTVRSVKITPPKIETATSCSTV